MFRVWVLGVRFWVLGGFCLRCFQLASRGTIQAAGRRGGHRAWPLASQRKLYLGLGV